jgi:DNA primase
MNASCLEIARAEGLRPGSKKTGSEYAFLCPWHQDRNPSLLINERKNCFGCFVCGIAGGPWLFAAKLAGISPNDKSAVARWLSERGL